MLLILIWDIQKMQTFHLQRFSVDPVLDNIQKAKLKWYVVMKNISPILQIQVKCTNLI